MKQIFTVQHAQSVHHTNGMVGAWSDWELTEYGRQQADKISWALRKDLIGKQAVLLTSDLRRAVQTAEPLLRYIPSAPVLCAQLREINEGEGNGKSLQWYQEHRAENPYGTYLSDYRAFPDAESYRDLWQRLEQFLTGLLEVPEEIVVLVSHGVTLQLFFALWIGLDFDALPQFGLSGTPGGISKLVLQDDGCRKIEYLNRIV